jgi:hypothetical protein
MLYLAPYIGAGTQTNPYRPRGSDQPGWTAVTDSRLDNWAGGDLYAYGLSRTQLSQFPKLKLRLLSLKGRSR